MKIVTPIKQHKVEIKDWITGREQQEIKKPITDVMMKITSKGESSTEINIGEAQRKSTEKAIEFVVVSIDNLYCNWLIIDTILYYKVKLFVDNIVVTT